MVHHVVVEDVALRVRWYSALPNYWPTATEISELFPLLVEPYELHIN
jgi:hypothetical protein